MFDVSAERVGGTGGARERGYAFFLLQRTASSRSFPIFDESARALIIVTIDTRSRLLGTTTVVPVMGDVGANFPGCPYTTGVKEVSSFVTKDSDYVYPTETVDGVPERGGEEFDKVGRGP